MDNTPREGEMSAQLANRITQLMLCEGEMSAQLANRITQPTPCEGETSG